jgi:hypothetical protein
MQLLNRSQLAEAIGRDPSYVSAMRKAGLQFTCGKITLRAALAWMAAHPDFTTRDVYPRRSNLTEAAGQGRARQRKSLPGTRRSLPV